MLAAPFLEVGIYMELDERLAAVAALVPDGSRVADIGTDHAYLPLRLAERGLEKIIAADKNSGPCDSARRMVGGSGFEERIEIRQGDGLTVLAPGEVDTVCIAGMGGELISNILEASPEVLSGLKRLVLQPMNDAALLRSWLLGHCWRIAAESLVKADGRLYVVICAVPGRQLVSSEVELIVGPCLSREKPPLFGELLASLIEKRARIIAGMDRSEVARESSRYRILQEDKKELEAIAECLNVR